MSFLDYSKTTGGGGLINNLPITEKQTGYDMSGYINDLCDRLNIKGTDQNTTGVFTIDSKIIDKIKKISGYNSFVVLSCRINEAGYLIVTIAPHLNLGGDLVDDAIEVEVNLTDPIGYTESEDQISWSEYFMSIAQISAKRSKDPVTKVGACIVDDNHIITGIGYNGFPRGCKDGLFPWGKQGKYSDTKFGYVVHAELNAILNSMKTEGCILYCTEYPCSECFKAIIQAGIKEVIYFNSPDLNKEKHVEFMKANQKMSNATGVKLTKYNP